MSVIYRLRLPSYGPSKMHLPRNVHFHSVAATWTNIWDTPSNWWWLNGNRDGSKMASLVEWFGKLWLIFWSGIRDSGCWLNESVQKQFGKLSQIRWFIFCQKMLTEIHFWKDQQSIYEFLQLNACLKSL